jgi:hypothetical protein
MEDVCVLHLQWKMGCNHHQLMLFRPMKDENLWGHKSYLNFLMATRNYEPCIVQNHIQDDSIIIWS